MHELGVNNLAVLVVFYTKHFFCNRLINRAACAIKKYNF